MIWLSLVSCKVYRYCRNMPLGPGYYISSREQASGSRAYLETRLSCLGTGFPLPEDFSERVREGIIFNLSDTSQRSEEKHLEPSFKVANSAVFSTSAVTVANFIIPMCTFSLICTVIYMNIQGVAQPFARGVKHGSKYTCD